MDEELSWISVNHHLSVDDEFEYIVGSSTISLDSDDGNDLSRKKIGYIRFHVFNMFCFDDLDEIIDTADSISGDELYLIETFLETGNIILGQEKVLCLDAIKVDDKYRSKGYGITAIKDLIRFSRVLGIDYIILIPAPIEGETFNEQRQEKVERLIHFYEKLDFELFSPGEGEPIMFLSL
ncbi:GNAT family N-acetyltransferase [Bacillus marasmi]|uniref:GNAT family N-acetyltransferase n=1 Tax=Bacillus marasmi TaxID=1926279 RepID=UPI0011C9F8C6|nr:GNAT family N-acetyltransferase [Bacillus marasmi]